MNEAQYSLVAVTDDTVTIRDEGPWDVFRTITNDAERVVNALMRNGHLHDGQRLFYYDSEGELGEIVVKHGRFMSFGV